MILGIEDSGRVISEGRVSGEAVCPPAVIDQNPHDGIHAIHERSLHYGEASGTGPFQGRANSDQSHLQGNVAADTNPFRTGDGEGFYLSKSRLNRYISCPRSYFIHYELGISPLRQDTDRLIGLSTHRLIAAHHLARKKDEFVDPNVMLDDFWSRHVREGDDAAIHQEMKAARNDSLRYAELFIREAPLDPLEIERAFTVPLGNLDNGDTLPVPLVGIVDLVDQPSGIPRPLEIKTRARKADDWQIRVALELTCYAYWVRQEIMAASREEPDEIPVGYIHIIKTKTPTIQWQTDTRTVEDFLELYRTAEAVHDSIREGRFYRNPGTHCNWCDFPAICGKNKDEVVKIFGAAARLRLWEADLI